MIRDALARLLAATPPPPYAAEIDELIAAFDAITARRQAILDELRTPFALAPEARALADQVIARQEAWQVALAQARDRLCAQRAAVGKLRRYATAP